EAVQAAAVAALSSSQACVAESRKIYKERRDVLCDGLSAAGFEVLRPKATFYVLVVCPKGLSSIQFASALLDGGVVATPATGFGAPGRVADVGVDGDTIVAVGELTNALGKSELDARGLAVAPGFINMLSHAEDSLAVDGRGLSDLVQGVTLEVFGEASRGPSD